MRGNREAHGDDDESTSEEGQMSLFDTLKAATDRARAEDSAEDREEIIRDWSASLVRLNQTITEWLQRYVDKKVIRVIDGEYTAKENSLGTYVVPSIRLVAGKQEVIFQPIGRFVAGATGRVDMFARGRTAEWERVRFLRHGYGDEVYWTMSPPRKQSSGEREVLPFNKLYFEQELDNLLR